MKRQLVSIAKFAGDTDNPFTEPMVRWHVFNAATNGLIDAGAVVRIGRRVFIDPAAFDRWIDAQQPKQVAA